MWQPPEQAFTVRPEASAPLGVVVWSDERDRWTMTERVALLDGGT